MDLESSLILFYSHFNLLFVVMGVLVSAAAVLAFSDSKHCFKIQKAEREEKNHRCMLFVELNCFPNLLL